jgi:hypothetical protein
MRQWKGIAQVGTGEQECVGRGCGAVKSREKSSVIEKAPVPKTEDLDSLAWSLSLFCNNQVTSPLRVCFCTHKLGIVAIFTSYNCCEDKRKLWMWKFAFKWKELDRQVALKEYY